MTPTDPDTTTYPTPGPARIEVDLAFGAVQLITSQRSTTVVTVRPATSGRRADLDLAAGTRVDFVGGVVCVAIPHRRLSSLLRPGAVSIRIEAPQGSSVRADVGYAHFIAEGSLGRCQVQSAYGDVRLGEVDEVEVKTSGGQVSVGVVHGSAAISNSYGNIRVGHAHGRCTLRNSAGDILVGTSHDGLRLKSAYGQITVEQAVGGSVDAVTSYGATDVAVADGTAVRLDVETRNGHVLNALTPSAAPREPAPMLHLRARSGWGDVTIRRAARHEGEPR